MWCATFVTFLGLLTSACVPDERPGEDVPEVTVKAQVSARASDRRKPRAAIAKTLTPHVARETKPPLDKPFFDDFERDQLGPNYRRTSRAWRIETGQLCVRDARNHPVWLRLPLPTNVRIEFDARSDSEDGDIKFELFGDGRSFARESSYQHASGYVLIFGGWKNTLHVLARHDEHGADRLELATRSGAKRLSERPVVVGQTYRFKVERTDGKTLSWSVDGEPLHVLADPEPLTGPGHAYFGFNDWATPVCFDNLSITPLKDA